MAELVASKENAVKVALDALQEGQIPPALTRKLFALQQAAVAKATGERSDTLSEPAIWVTIAPIVARSRHSHGRARHARKDIYPLLIPAQLADDGGLAPHYEEGVALPWLPRALLEPTSSHLVLGDVQALDDFLTRTPFRAKAGSEAEWPIVWDFAWKLFRAVAGKEWRQFFAEAGYDVTDEALVVVDDQLRGVGQNILRVYDLLRTTRTIPPLLAAYLEPYPPAPAAPLSLEQWRSPAMRHLGSFQKQFPLSPSQREALYHFLQLEEHTVLAVSGPPGTGKTTLLHSVIASLMVEAALAGKQPPVIVVSSTNNQAVTNVLDSLHHVAGVERWIDVPGFGLYLTNNPQKQKEAEQRGIPVANRWDDGFPAEVESWEFVDAAETQFLKRCSTHFRKTIPSVDRAVRILHEALSQKAELLSSGIHTAYFIRELRQGQEARTKQAESLAAAHAEAERELRSAQLCLDGVKGVLNRWLRHVRAEPFHYGLLGFLPFIRQKRMYRNLQFLQEFLPDLVDQPQVEAIRRKLTARQREAQKEVERWQAKAAHDRAELKELELMASEVKKAERAWRTWTAGQKASFLTLEDFFVFEDGSGEPNPRSFFNWLDTHLRHELFTLATHYWEGRWLQEAHRGVLSRDGSTGSQSRSAQEEKWRRYAMLFPCFVTTMHSGPGFFDYFNGQPVPLDSFIDLLVVDEAGQVSPEVSGAMFALAKQALVVGDVKQIEPLWSVPEPVDEGNVRRRVGRPFDALRVQGSTASSGSVMRMAQHISPYQLDGQRGMFLAEHRRSVPEIIEYCNRLAYGGRLRKKRPSISDYPWPHMGYVHVKGQSERRAGSRLNRREAGTLVAWLAENREALETYYQMQLDDIAGIITPFAAQRAVLQRALHEHNLTVRKVGTVHALQGGERPVVLCSTVYSSRDGGTYFFDRGVNMLNVAVSRARDSFIVFGDMDILDPDRKTPSGLLARFLFGDKENELVDAPLTPRSGNTPPTGDHRVTTLEKHVAVLARAFESAQERLVIVSPYLRWRAVEADDICEKTAAAVARGVTVLIYVDDHFNEDLTLPAAAQAAAALRASGAVVKVCHNIHSKTICIDDRVLIEGSFNWLSAERSIPDYRRLESSLIDTSPHVRDHIAETLRDLEQRTKQKGDRPA